MSNDANTTITFGTEGIERAWGMYKDPMKLPATESLKAVHIWHGKFIVERMVVVATFEEPSKYWDDVCDSLVGLVYKDELHQICQEGGSATEVLARSAYLPASEGRMGAMKAIASNFGMPRR